MPLVRADVPRAHAFYATLDNRGVGIKVLFVVGIRSEVQLWERDA